MKNTYLWSLFSIYVAVPIFIGEIYATLDNILFYVYNPTDFYYYSFLHNCNQQSSC